MDLNSFSASGGGNFNKFFPKIPMPGGLPGGDVEVSIWLVHKDHGDTIIWTKRAWFSLLNRNEYKISGSERNINRHSGQSTVCQASPTAILKRIPRINQKIYAELSPTSRYVRTISRNCYSGYSTSTNRIEFEDDRFLQNRPSKEVH